MKKKIIRTLSVCIAFFFIFSFQLNAQDTSEITRINEIADKDQATFADGVYLVVLLMGETPASFSENIEKLNREGITAKITVEENAPLRRGAFSLMMARHLNLGDSLLYRIFKTGRYAYRACAANGIMSPDGSEWDKISGGELIEIITKVSDLTGGNE